MQPDLLDSGDQKSAPNTEEISRLSSRIQELEGEITNFKKTITRYSEELRKCDLEKEFGDRLIIHVCDFVESLESVRSDKSAYNAVKTFVEAVSPVMVEYGEKFKELRDSRLRNK